MRFIEPFWIDGMMPLQFLFLLGITFLVFLMSHFLLKRIGLGIPVFGQIILIWLTAYFILRYIVHPPLPITMIYNYMGIVIFVLFLFVSATEETWKAFKRPILSTIRAETGKYRVSRIVVFSLFPFFSFIGTYN